MPPHKRTTVAVYFLALLAPAIAAGSSSSSSSSLSSVSTGSNGTASRGADWFCGESGVETDYIKLDNKQDDRYFYWFVRSRSASAATDPLVVWLNGGPGASSLRGLLYVNGPCIVQPDGSVKRNDYAWNTNANVIWLDQPSGVGFSYFTNDADRDYKGDDVGRNMYAFLNGFVGKHPEFVERPLYLTGESYAGHFIPAAAHYIWTMNKQLKASARRVYLQGFAIGNGDSHIVLQSKYASAMANNNNYNLTLLNATQIVQMNADADECAMLLPTCIPYNASDAGCSQISGWCDSVLLNPYADSHRSVYDIRQPCIDTDECLVSGSSIVGNFINADAVQTALAPVIQNRTWSGSNENVFYNFLDSGDWARVYTPEIAEMLNDGLRVLIYAGDADLVCNWLGNRAWTLALDWKGKVGYNAASETAFAVPVDPLGLTGSETGTETTTVAGSTWQFENLAFVRVGESGHLVPRNQPRAALVMINRFFNNQPM